MRVETRQSGGSKEGARVIIDKTSSTDLLKHQYILNKDELKDPIGVHGPIHSEAEQEGSK